MYVHSSDQLPRVLEVSRQKCYSILLSIGAGHVCELLRNRGFAHGWLGSPVVPVLENGSSWPHLYCLYGEFKDQFGIRCNMSTKHHDLSQGNI